ncbi:extragenic suppressor protein SuhB [Salmonella enterica subsp. enterica serovar Enteritidis]|nr:extragenic suppressor protein SuhB [Salmonella enterica subsp. enterica serovar Enteritidis]
MHPMLTIAVRAARKAGNVIAKNYETPDAVEASQKGSNDFVTNVDKAAEAVIIDTIRKSYPQHTIITEESGEHVGTDQDVQWVIDPLDGTTNFIKRLPHFSVSIAVRIKGRTEVAVVYDPMRNELFTATPRSGRTAERLPSARQYRARSGRHYPRYWLPVQSQTIRDHLH